MSPLLLKLEKEEPYKVYKFDLRFKEVNFLLKFNTVGCLTCQAIVHKSAVHWVMSTQPF